MKEFKLVGKIFKKDLGVGAWGIKSENGIEYRPISMPEQLKSTGASVALTVQEIEEVFSIHIWGKPIKIIGFHTLSP